MTDPSPAITNADMVALDRAARFGWTQRGDIERVGGVPERLEAAGLIGLSPLPPVRSQQAVRVTEAGHDVCQAWLAAPAAVNTGCPGGPGLGHARDAAGAGPSPTAPAANAHSGGR